MRILHVVGSMNTGGIETWLMHVLRRIDRNRCRFDFLTHTVEPCSYDEEIRSLGCRIIPCLHPSRPHQYVYHFLKALKQCGPYDVVHSHVHHFSGVPLLLAHRAGVPARIAHSHSDLSFSDRRAALLRRLYLRITEWLVRRHATAGFACSSRAAAALYGRAWTSDDRWRVLPYGIDLKPFGQPVDPPGIRGKLGIPSDAFVVGHVGRFCEQKNHDKLLSVFAEIARKESKARLLMVGEGMLKPAMERKAASMGLAHQVVFAGLRKDIAALMLGAMDVFLFPSRWEGLPMVLIEAQAAGLPCVISDVVTDEIDGGGGRRMLRLSLDRAAGDWAEAVFALRGRRETRLSGAVSPLEGSAFDIRVCMRQLQELYERVAGEH